MLLKAYFQTYLEYIKTKKIFSKKINFQLYFPLKSSCLSIIMKFVTMNQMFDINKKSRYFYVDPQATSSNIIMELFFFLASLGTSTPSLWENV